MCLGLFSTKFGSSSREDAKQIVAKYKPLIEKAEALIPEVAKVEDMLVDSSKCLCVCVWLFDRY